MIKKDNHNIRKNKLRKFIKKIIKNDKKYKKGKLYYIRLFFLFLILFFTIYLIHPLYTSNTKIKNYNIIYPINDKFNKETNIYEIEQGSFLFPLYSEYLFPGLDGFIQKRNFFKNQIILLSFQGKEGNSKTLFHEYLHYLYFHSKISDAEKIKIMEEIGKDKYELGNLFLQTFLIYDNSHDLNVGLTEYISHTYDAYYNNCKKKKDNITNLLIKNKLLPYIYCKDIK